MNQRQRFEQDLEQQMFPQSDPLFSFTRIGQVYTDEETGLDDHITYHRVEADAGRLAHYEGWEANLRGLVEGHFPSKRCIHEYDCCGQMYQSDPVLILSKWDDGDFREAVVSQRHYRNV